MQLGFGSGVCVATPLTDAFGNAIANPTPVQFGIMQDISVDFSFDVKELFGQYQFPVAVGRGKGKVQGKAKLAQLNGITLNTVVFGQTLTTGLLNDVIDTVGTAVPTTPYQITPTVPGSGTWTNDLGVIGPNGVIWQRVASAPATGQYSVAAGVYTFAAADTGLIMKISYQYTGTSTTAKKLTVNNVLMGQAPQFRADLMIPYNGKSLVLTLPACISTKLTMATKLDDFFIPEYDFSCFADGNNNIAYLGLAE